jgi:hypothetical protein
MSSGIVKRSNELDVHAQLMQVRGDLGECVAAIKKVEDQIESVDAEIKQLPAEDGMDAKTLEYWRSEEVSLRAKEASLRDEKASLRVKETSLGQKETLLLGKVELAPVSSSAGSILFCSCLLFVRLSCLPSSSFQLVCTLCLLPTRL